MCFRVNRVLLSSLTYIGLSLLAPALWADSLLNGLAVHKELNKEQFIGALYSNTLSSEASGLLASSGAKRMELKVVAKRLSARRLNSLWIEGMAINNPTSLLAAQAESMVAFTALVKRSLRAGDVLSIRGEGTTTTVTLNDIKLGSIESEQFFDMVMRTWIGNVPLSSDFRDAILTNGSVDTELLARYEAISPSDARRQAIAKWLEPAKPKATVAAAAPAAPQAIIAAAPEKPTIAPPPVIQKPAIAVAAPVAAPEAVEPVEAPTDVAALADEEAFLDDEFLDEEEYEEEAPLLTAESLLNRQLYHSQLLKWTYKYIRYPKRAVSRGHEGSVRVAVVIDRKGNVKNVSEIESSKYSTLNKEALGAVNRAVPFPEIPEGIEGEEFAFSLPIVFRLPK